RWSRRTWSRSGKSGNAATATAESRGLPPSVDVVEAHDIVLAEIAADLHLDQFERDLAGIGEPMNAADRDIDRLVLVHAAHVVAESDLGRSCDHHPMFRPVEVLLQRELAAWLNDDALHSVTWSDVDVLIVAPRPIDAAVLDRRAMVIGHGATIR